MAPDILSSVYHLPRVITWESVSNLEALTKLEMSSKVTGVSELDFLTERNFKAIRCFQMRNQAREEAKLVEEEMQRVAEFYAIEHCHLQQHIDSLLSSQKANSHTPYENGCLHLLHHRLLACKEALKLFSQCCPDNVHLQLPAFHFSDSRLNPPHLSTHDHATADDDLDKIPEQRTDGESSTDDEDFDDEVF